MSSTEDVSPLGTTPTAAAGASATADAEDAAPASVEAAPSPSDTLSPAVRRLVRQFDLDITGIHGTGPAGRIRVGDVMGLLGGRTDSGNRDAPARPITPEDDLDDARRDRGSCAAKAGSGRSARPRCRPDEHGLRLRPEPRASAPPQAAPRERGAADDELLSDGARRCARRGPGNHDGRTAALRRVADDGRRRTALIVPRRTERVAGGRARRTRSRDRRCVAHEPRCRRRAREPARPSLRRERQPSRDTDADRHRATRQASASAACAARSSCAASTAWSLRASLRAAI